MGEGGRERGRGEGEKREGSREGLVSAKGREMAGFLGSGRPIEVLGVVSDGEQREERRKGGEIEGAASGEERRRVGKRERVQGVCCLSLYY